MVGVRKSISTAIVALAVASVVHADMVPVSPSQGEDRRVLPVGSPAVSRPASDWCRAQEPFGVFGAVDWSPVGFLPEAKPEAADVATHPPQILTDRQNSFSLCLYTLLGLAACRTAPWLKRLHLSVMPDWYHSGGPFQIGHSFAISPDCLPSTAALCFLQPDNKSDEDPAAPYFRGTIASLLRKSQFIPTVLASRGPPHLANEPFFA